KMENAMPSTGVKKIYFYTPNPVMQTEESGTGVLGKCENLFGSEDYDEGTTATTFCQGTGTMDGYDINFLGHMLILSEGDTLLLEEEIFLKKDIYSAEIVLNPAMQTDESGTGVLGKCENLLGSEDYDEGTTATTFCQGTGTSNGKTIFEKANENDIMLSLFLSYEFLVSKTDLPYFEFTISGKNTYKQKDIWYDVVLNHGDVPEGKLEENRINDESLRFALLEVNGENQKNIFNNRSYSSLENKRIHVETIPKNTMNEINKTYRLYMWIDDSVVIGNVNEDYTTEEWKDVFASIKVSVTGDFNEKNYTDESCFETQVVSNYIHNSNITEDQINTCVSYISDKISLYEEENYEAYCAGTGTGNGATLENGLKRGWQFTDDDVIYLLENNIILKSNDSIAITDYDESCGSDVIIPNKINGYEVTEIVDSAFNDKNIKSVILPNTMKVIRGNAFTDNQILSVKIPSSVSYLSCHAFYMFQETVTIEKEENLVCVEDIMM
ncbi:MAG: leucine-rich repeat protein, partial [Bacilli bacterium]|nr:leucine-rich repeat protein [Bacilli bacterium]